ncbi:MAG: hypothetical protein SPJ09_00925 [Erysipelotrichaceae bacterium]|nr:hypothetical protein [Erysipelotrichaceae bacterium]
MFDYSNMLKRAIEFFPIWSDIRKRGSKSIGGMLVKSALDETLELEQAIQEYKDFYFLNKYQNKEDDIITYVYSANISLLEDLNDVSVIYNNEQLILTLDIDDFYNNKNLSYYENGLIYIHEDKYTPEVKQIRIIIDEYSYSYQLEKKHVWNIFDEFACFVGIERHLNESNASLRDRILFSTKNMANNSEQGLKNAIMTELIGIFPEMKSDEIQISKVTPESLMKPYKEFNSLLDMLSSVNRDVLKDKRWDLDKWSYDFKSIEFLDNVWDEVIEEYQNGIGYDDAQYFESVPEYKREYDNIEKGEYNMQAVQLPNGQYVTNVSDFLTWCKYGGRKMVKNPKVLRVNVISCNVDHVEIPPKFKKDRSMLVIAAKNLTLN